jgi:hypothetical protein
MSDRPRIPPPGFDDLSLDEQISYVEALWAHIGAPATDISLPDWHRRVIKERLESGSLDHAEDWTVVRNRIERRLNDPGG